MGTVVGVVLGYVLRATTGSGGFDEVLAQSRAVRDSDEFQGLMRAVHHHGRTVLRDLTVTLAQRAEDFSEMLGPPPELPEPANPWARWGMSPTDEAPPG